MAGSPILATRRAVLAGAALLPAFLPGALRAAEGAGALIRRPIPSSGEQLPAIGIGTSRRYEVEPVPEKIAPLREAVERFVALGGTVNFVLDYALFTVLLMMFAVIATNFTAISLEPMGNLAGTATAITGFVSTTFGAVLGGAVGQMFNGTVQPLFAGFAIFGAVSVAATLWAEKGKLFTHPGDSPQLDAGAAHF